MKCTTMAVIDAQKRLAKIGGSMMSMMEPDSWVFPAPRVSAPLIVPVYTLFMYKNILVYDESWNRSCDGPAGRHLPRIYR